MSFADYATAAKARDAIQKIIANWMAINRPTYTYATVVSFDNPSNSAVVTPNGQTTSVKVSMGRERPTAAGQIVRVEGLPGDRYISDVLYGA
jgi:hypothetical protein